MHSVRQQSLTTLEDLNTQSGIGLALFLQKVKATLQNLSDPNEPFLLCFMMMEKL